MIAKAGILRSSQKLRDEALLMLEGRGAVLETARHVSRILLDNKIAGAVIGGVAVTLHGHVRTTSDVDVYVPEPLAAFAEHLEAAGYEFDRRSRAFVRGVVPVLLVAPSEANPTPTHFVSIKGVLTVSLADLINLKLRSGLSSVLRSHDIADVAGLIRTHQIDGRFSSHIQKELRSDFRGLVNAVRSASKKRGAGGSKPYGHSE